MAGSNEFLLFGLGGGANVITQSAYAALAARTDGFIAGTANSAELNKVWRQSAFVAASLAQIIANNNVNVSDDGNVSSFITKFLAALFVSPALTGVPTAPTPTTADNSTLIATTAFVRNNLSSYYTAGQVAANFATISQVNTAQATANTANTVASNALNSANNAQTSANNAQSTANEAHVQFLGSAWPFGGGYVNDIAASRSLGATFTNTYGRAIMVYVRVASASGARHAEGYVNGAAASHGFANVGSCEGTLCFVVPVGQTYRVDALSGFLNLLGWYEIH